MFIGDKRKDGVISRIGAPIDRPLTDLNVDCRTDSHDLISLLEQWGDTESPADFDGDGIVGYFDLPLLLDHWG